MDLQHIERDKEELKKINKLISEKEEEIFIKAINLDDSLKYMDYEELFGQVEEYVSYIVSRDALMKKISKSYKKMNNRIKKYGKSYLSMPEIVREYMSKKPYRCK